MAKCWESTKCSYLMHWPLKVIIKQQTRHLVDANCIQNKQIHHLSFASITQHDESEIYSTFPGFINPLGSTADLIFFIRVTPASPSSFTNRWRFPIPTPCSPVHVPFNFSAALQRRFIGALSFQNVASTPKKNELVSSRSFQQWYFTQQVPLIGKDKMQWKCIKAFLASIAMTLHQFNNPATMRQNVDFNKSWSGKMVNWQISILTDQSHFQ